MYDVLLAIDQHKSRALAQAATITGIPVETDAMRVRVLHVFTENPDGATIQQLGAAKAVERALSERGIEYVLEERSGDPAAEVLEHAAEHDVDLICLAGRKRSPTGKALFGSVTP
ncbi:universal stress protein [Haloterrigena alkaliphila]|uniref:universal stress protein n=1 Tax=Haloterrigena alkaliphila TaxID=2816475 RepID=UPI001CEC9844|nr:universal stress protein [Haloterrigena alkaliphila]UHQ95009.1 universal stress protein [Haloterrigena alkaliphila]